MSESKGKKGEKGKKRKEKQSKVFYFPSKIMFVDINFNNKIIKFKIDNSHYFLLDTDRLTDIATIDYSSNSEY